MSYPGQGQHSYSGNGYNNNQGGGYGGGGYGGPPSGPPPSQSYGGYGGNGYGGPPSGPPPGHSGGGYGGGYGGNNEGRYGGNNGGYDGNNGSRYGGDNQGGYNGNNGGGYNGNNGGGYNGNNGGNNNNGGYQQQQQQQQSNQGQQGGGYYHGRHSNRDSQFQAPPSQAQSFGVDGYNFQYSNCSGKRKALLIGINYIGQKNALRGCINDVKNVRAFLLQHGYKEEDMVILTDDQQNSKAIPTRANILRGMQWLVAGAQTNDSLFLHYSGHGGQTQDTDGDEEDGNDEVIYPVDYEQASHITDDEIHNAVVSPLMPGVRLTALFDSCHSGTVLDLPYVYSTKGVLKEPNLLKEAGSGLLSAVTSYASGDMNGVMSSVSGLFKRVTSGNDGYEKTKQTKTAPCDAILISGCKDSQTSADAFENGQATGAMSHSFITVMEANPNQSYLTLLNEMRDVLDDKYEQKPQLSSSHPIDCNLKFIF